MMLMRRTLLAALALFLAACSSETPPSAADGNGPAAVVRALYDPYLAGDAVTPPPWYDAAPLTTDLRTQLSQADAANDGQTPIEADPIIAGQDYRLTTVDVALDAPPSNGRASVTARFNNMGTATVVRYDLLETEGVWQIDNIRSDPGFDLREEIAAAIRNGP